MKKDELITQLEKFNASEAAEQTLMTWIQTGLTLIGFGFGIGSFIAFMKTEHYDKIIIKAIRVIGELLILVGLVSIVLALLQHKRKVRSVRKDDYHFHSTFSLSSFIGVMVALLGLAAFVAILIHIIA